MENFSEISILEEKRRFIKARSVLRKSMDILKDKTGEYAEHHQFLINTYTEIISLLDTAQADSQSVGKGV